MVERHLVLGRRGRKREETEKKYCKQQFTGLFDRRDLLQEEIHHLPQEVCQGHNWLSQSGWFQFGGLQLQDKVELLGHTSCACFIDMDKLDYCAVIKFFILDGLTSKEIHLKLIKVYGNSAPSISTVKKWVAEFKCGHTLIKDNAFEGRAKN
ncbi:GVQW3 [Cordylochernes scorpioides]|uniref:GVQW3 n=1 Tax=Cordylochernes scorpioides TaxID=51811 RepID=A0ABY6KRE2_9ARAC|nr:GVQW3 [Cordylochernes scorpioides]